VGLQDAIREDHVFPTVAAAVAAFEAGRVDRHRNEGGIRDE